MATDWKKIKAEYIRGGISYRQLAEKYGVSSNAIFRKGKQENWTDLKKQSQRKADAKLVESVAEKDAKRVDKIVDIADVLLDKIYDAIQNDDLFSYALTSKAGLKGLTGALKDIRDIKGIKTDLDLQEQMARIEKLRKEAQEESQEAKDIKVIISGDLENYAK